MPRKWLTLRGCRCLACLRCNIGAVLSSLIPLDVFLLSFLLLLVSLYLSVPSPLCSSGIGFSLIVSAAFDLLLSVAPPVAFALALISSPDDRPSCCFALCCPSATVARRALASSSCHTRAKSTSTRALVLSNRQAGAEGREKDRERRGLEQARQKRRRKRASRRKQDHETQRGKKTQQRRE